MQRRSRGYNKSFNDNGASNGQGRGFRSNGFSRGPRPQAMKVVSPFNFSTGRGGLLASIKVNRLPEQVENSGSGGFDSSGKIGSPGRGGLISSGKIESSGRGGLISSQTVERFPLQEVVEQQKEVLPEVNGLSQKVSTPPWVVHKEVTDIPMENEPAWIVDKSSDKPVSLGGNEVKTLRCQECASLRQNIVNVFRSAAKNFNDFADVMQHFNDDKNNN
ncbi:hypothetical protein Mgra_00004195 [Meloidogyne graminicola]|uniref:Uncharacterized protein n=1 Tax=Meloidogyne graminicola TaxID=189291 RepID=A0A8S9ZTU5_9BILA|nr:hypothetical protein Mgra_00004195 [Meloidogyne graminicola]